MIGSFRSRALAHLWEKGDERGIKSDHRRRTKAILSMLHSAERLEDLNVPGFYLHALKGVKPRRYSLRVSANWRDTFAWRDGRAERVDYEDYR